MNALSLFSGAGGMDIGIQQAGFNILACIENDPHCCNTLRHIVEMEQKNTEILELDITTVDPQTLLKRFNLAIGELDLLVGGPPCQAFSQIGKQLSILDERGLLLFEMVRFAQILRPKVVLIEQVKGLLNAKDSKGQKGGVLLSLIEQFENLNYRVDWNLILAADFGVPQLRERVFIVCQQKSERPFQFPQPTHRNPQHTNLFNSHLPIYRTVADALADLGPPESKNKLYFQNNNHIDVTTERDRERINGVPEGLWLSSQINLPKDQLCNLTKKDTTKFRRLAFNAPSLTLRCGEIFFHPTENRILTPKEYLRIHGYPDNYILKGPVRSRSGSVKSLDQHRQVANSVPPPVAYTLGLQIAKVLECQHYMKSLAIN